MPDLATHALISFTGIQIYNIIRRKRPFSRATIYLFVLGGVFPDILEKMIPYTIYYLFSDSIPLRVSLFYLHTPIMLLLSVYILCLFFVETYRKIAFIALSAGVSSHLFLDLLQGNICDKGYMWFFPFSTAKPMVVNMFYDDGTTTLIPYFLIIAIGIELIYRKIKRC